MSSLATSGQRAGANVNVNANGKAQGAIGYWLLAIGSRCESPYKLRPWRIPHSIPRCGLIGAPTHTHLVTNSDPVQLQG
jgi:hypothetical protein